MAFLPLIGMAATAIGAGVSAYGAIEGGQAQSRMYQYQAGVAEINRKIALQNADYERKVGEVQAQESGLQSRFQIGTAKAGQGASNLDINRGSAAAVRESMQTVAQQQQGIVRANAARRAYGYEVEAAGSKAQEAVYGMSADTARTAGYLGGISSILGGAAGVASKWTQAQSIGLNPLSLGT